MISFDCLTVGTLHSNLQVSVENIFKNFQKKL